MSKASSARAGFSRPSCSRSLARPDSEAALDIVQLHVIDLGTIERLGTIQLEQPEQLPATASNRLDQRLELIGQLRRVLPFRDPDEQTRRARQQALSATFAFPTFDRGERLPVGFRA